MFAQIIGGVIYGIILGPYFALSIPFYVGWIFLAVGLLFFFSPSIYFPRPQDGKGVMDTTVIVWSGTFGIVRHPQVLGCLLLMLGSILVSQHWLSMLVAVPIVALFHRYVLKEEHNLIVKFGDGYKHYMQSVPSMNPVLGIVRLARRRRRHQTIKNGARA
jgi:protein-S-isoprenylcysteine O-methyltransferase Ste14